MSITEKCLIEYNYEAEDGIVEFNGLVEHSVELVCFMCFCNACGHLWNSRKEVFGKRID